MKKFLLGAAAAIAVAAPGVAAAQTGHVGAVYTNVDIDGAPDDSDAYGVEGSVYFGGAGTVGFEVDAAIVDSDDTDTGYGLTGHILSRNDRHLFGGFVGIAGNDDSETWTGGLEGAKYYDRWTLWGSASYASNDDADLDGYGVNIGASIFGSDNLRFDANIGWATIDDGVDDDDALAYGLGAEYQFAAMPISIGANYTIVDGDAAEADILGVALRYNWDSSLLERDRNGASQAGRTGVGSIVGL